MMRVKFFGHLLTEDETSYLLSASLIFIAVWIATLFGLFNLGVKSGYSEHHEEEVNLLIHMQEEHNGAPLLLYPPKYIIGENHYESCNKN